jgi:hypothetical protein
MKSSNQVKAISFFLVSLFIVLTFFIINVNAAQVTWTLETVDAAADVGVYTCIALDSHNRPHISYFDDLWKNLKYARWTGSTWSIEPVDTVGDVGYGTSLALDSSDRPHISYTDWPTGNLKYAQWTGSVWNIEVVDVAYPLSDTSIVVDSSAHAHICYRGTDSYLKHARWTGSSWTIETVDQVANPAFISLVLDSLGRPHISYNDETNRDLKYAIKTGSPWSISTIDSDGDVGRCNSIALGSSDRPHISYWDNTNNNLKYARWTGSAWSIETVDAADKVGQFTSIAVDSLDRPHISYTDHKWFDLKYAIGTVVGWFIRTVDTVGDVGYYTSIALDSSDHAHISYYDNDNHNLKYARNPDETFNSWIFSTSDSDGDSNKDLVELTFDVDTTFSGSLSVYVYMELRQTTGPVWVYNYTTISITSTLPDSTTLSLMLPQEAPPGPYELYVWLEDDGATIEDAILFDAGTLYPPQTSQVGYLTGTVTDEDTSFPLSAISVLINGDFMVDTNSSGQYTIELPAGMYNVTFEDWSWFYNSITVEDVSVVAGSTTTQDVMLHIDVYILELQIQGSGTLDPGVGNYQYSREAQVEVEVQATPDSGWIFSNWLLDSVNIGSENPFTVLMDSDHNLTAIFTEEPQVGFLAGQVTDFDTGLPVAEAEISVNGTTKLTDPAGNYEFELVPGEYNVTVGRLGYNNETRLVTITAAVINVQDFLLQKTNRILVIEVEGMGSTNPAAGSYEYSFSTEIVVEAFPNPGWSLGNWVFDLIWYGPEDAFPLIMDNDHELMIVFVEDTAMEPFIESCGEDGGQKDSFSQGENMYVTGGFFSPGTFEIYIVNDVESWTDGMAIPSRVPGTETTISANLEGHIPPTNVWGNLETVGEYDIVIDVNDNGLYDVGVDASDDGDIEVTAGVEIIPEINSLTIMILLMTATLIVIIFKKEEKK